MRAYSVIETCIAGDDLELIKPRGDKSESRSRRRLTLLLMNIFLTYASITCKKSISTQAIIHSKPSKPNPRMDVMLLLTKINSYKCVTFFT